jgi:hypothetical protein
MKNCTYTADAFERYMRGEGINPVSGDIGIGARGIVAARPWEEGHGHVFHILNQQGRVLFVDVQTGFVDPMAFKTFKLMRAN